MGVEFEARGLRGRLALSWNPTRLGSATVLVRSAGLGAARLPRLDGTLEGFPAEAVLVTGLAGGCAPGIAPGDMVVASAVGPTDGGAWLEPDPQLSRQATGALQRASVPYRTGRLLTTCEVVATPEAKAGAWQAHGALAVDMESAHVLAWAARRGLPALAVRAVADGPSDRLPPALTRAVTPAGRVRAAAVLRWVARPTLLREAWRLGRRSGAALDRLARFLTAFVATAVEL